MNFLKMARLTAFALLLIAVGYGAAQAQASFSLWVGGNPVSLSNPLPVSCQ